MLEQFGLLRFSMAFPEFVLKKKLFILEVAILGLSCQTVEECWRGQLVNICGLYGGARCCHFQGLSTTGAYEILA